MDFPNVALGVLLIAAAASALTPTKPSVEILEVRPGSSSISAYPSAKDNGAPGEHSSAGEMASGVLKPQERTAGDGSKVSPGRVQSHGKAIRAAGKASAGIS